MRYASLLSLGVVLTFLGGTLGGCGDDPGGDEFPPTGSTSGTGTGGEGGSLFTTSSSSTTTGTGGGGGTMSCDPNPTEGVHAWSRNPTDPAGQSGTQIANAVAVDGQGNVAVVGVFQGSVVFGSTTLTSVGGNDLFIAKLGPTGTPLWAKRFGDPDEQSVRGVAFDPQGNIVVTGNYRGTVNFGGGNLLFVDFNDFNQMFLAKLDGQQGNHIWSKDIGAVNNETGLGLAINAAGDIALVGEYQTSINFGGGVTITNSSGAATFDAFVAVLDALGNIKWARGLGDAAGQPTAGHQRAFGIALDPMGNLLVTGTASGSIDLGLGSEVVTGMSNAFVVKMSATGAPVWGALYGTDQASGAAVAADGQGNVFIAGDHAGDISFGGATFTTQLDVNAFVAKLDPSGGHVWSKSLGNNLAQHARGITVGENGRAIVTGDFGGTMDFGGASLTAAGANDAFLAKLDTVGCPIWTKAFGDAASQVGNAVVARPSGTSIVAGRMAGNANFGGAVLTAAGDDIFVAELGP